MLEITTMYKKKAQKARKLAQVDYIINQMISKNGRWSRHLKERGPQADKKGDVLENKCDKISEGRPLTRWCDEVEKCNKH